MSADPPPIPEGGEGSDPEPMPTGLTMADTARHASRLRWAVERLAGIIGSWAAGTEDASCGPGRPDGAPSSIGSWAAGTEDARAAVWLATVARHLEQHSDGLEGLRPGYEALAEAARPASPRPEIDEALDGIAAAAGSAERMGIACRVLLEHLSAHCVALRAVTAAHADAPLDRALEFLMADLRRDRSAGEALLDGLDADETAAVLSADAAASAESRLAAAGGIF